MHVQVYMRMSILCVRFTEKYLASVIQTMIAWTDGIERAPDKKHVREIPQRFTWSSSLWTSQYGDIWRRTFNPISNEWSWTDKPSLVLDESGRQGLHLPHFLSVETLICMAWRRRTPDTPTKVYWQNVDQPVTAHNLCWKEEDDSDEPARLPGETWRPIKCKIGFVPCGDSRYQISNFARLKNPENHITSGFWWDGRYWASIKNCGLLDLTSCARGWRTLDGIPGSIEQAMNALACGVEPADFADHRGIKETSAWSSYTKAAQHLRPSELRKACQEIVMPKLWRVLSQLKGEENVILGESLTDLLEEVDERLPGFAKHELRFEQLRLARMGLVA